tara:strand:- start:857 stop:2908 length:2052 start_codon:yes stop_codon:yes gene_type:complete
MKITINYIKNDYYRKINHLKIKHNNQKNFLINNERNKANHAINSYRNYYNTILKRQKEKYNNSIRVKNLQIGIIMQQKRKNDKILVNKLNSLSSKLKQNEKLVRSLKYKSKMKDIRYKLEMANLKRIQKNTIRQYKNREKIINSKVNNQINNYKAKALQDFKAGYISAQRVYNRKLQLKNSEINRMRSAGSNLLITYKKAQIKAEMIAKNRGIIIRNLANAYNRANSTIRVMRAKNNADKLKYASMVKQRNDLIQSRNNVIRYFNTKTITLKRNFNAEKAKNKALLSIIKAQNISLNQKNNQLNLVNNRNKNIYRYYRKLLLNQKKQIIKLKESKNLLSNKNKSLGNSIRILYNKIKNRDLLIKNNEAKITQNYAIIHNLKAKQLANLDTINKLKSELRNKISVSECGSRGYTATAGIKQNKHVFNGKRYIKEESIIGDRIFLNGKQYVRLINGKCLNQYSRPCPKPKIIFKRPKRSSTASDLVKHNILYRNYRCALVRNAKNKRFAYKRWIQQRNLIRAKTRKYPRYPPFNSRMCGSRRSGSRSGNRCVGNCAKYRMLINSYRIKISKLNRQYNFYRSRSSSYRRLFRRYNGSQRGTPAYTYKMMYSRYLNAYRRTSGWRRRRNKSLYIRYLNLLRAQIKRGRPYQNLISKYSRLASSRKRLINTYNNIIRKYQKAYPRQLR